MVLWTQIASVVYIIAFVAFLIVLQIRFRRDGALHWQAIEWTHVTRGVRGVGPAWMAVWRLTFATYVIISLVIAFSTPRKPSKDGQVAVSGFIILATFTVWSWMLIGFYGLFTGIASALDAAGVVATGKLARIFACLVWVSFETLTSGAILVFLVVWLILVPLDPSLMHNWLPLSMHNLNVVFMGVEMLLNRMSFVSAHVIFSLYYGLTYIVFSMCFCVYTGIIFYPFIDWRHWIVLPGYTGLILTLWGAFAGVGCLAAWAKRNVSEELPDCRSLSLEGTRELASPIGQ